MRKRASTVLGPGKADNLEAFAKRIAQRLKQANTAASTERLICRLMQGEDGKVAAMLLAKWVTWRYGEPKQSSEITGKDGEPLRVIIEDIGRTKG